MDRLTPEQLVFRLDIWRKLHSHWLPDQADRQLVELRDQLQSLSQEAVIKGHMRGGKELVEENSKLAAGSCVHELIGDSYGHFECSKVIELQASIAELEKERDQQERFKWSANERSDLIRQVVRTALDNCTHPRCMYDRELVGYSECAGGHLAKQVDAAIDAALKDRA